MKKLKDNYDGIGLYFLEKLVCAGDNWCFPYPNNMVKVRISYIIYHKKDAFIVSVSDADDETYNKSYTNREEALEVYNNISDGIFAKELLEKGFN